MFFFSVDGLIIIRLVECPCGDALEFTPSVVESQQESDHDGSITF